MVVRILIFRMYLTNGCLKGEQRWFRTHSVQRWASSSRGWAMTPIPRRHVRGRNYDEVFPQSEPNLIKSSFRRMSMPSLTPPSTNLTGRSSCSAQGKRHGVWLLV